MKSPLNLIKSPFKSYKTTILTRLSPYGNLRRCDVGSLAPRHGSHVGESHQREAGARGGNGGMIHHCKQYFIIGYIYTDM